MTGDLTALILTFNERENIARTLSALSFPKNIVLIDSGSTDDTIEIARRVQPDVRVVERPFDSFSGQCNFALSQITTEWVLSLDADYELSRDLQVEIAKLEPPEDIAGYSAGFIYRIYGHPLRSSAYPPRTVLYRRNKARYRDEGHGHRVVIDGKIGQLAGKIYHDDRKPLSHWIRAQERYAVIEAKHLLGLPNAECRLPNEERGELPIGDCRMPIEPSGLRDFSVSLSLQDRLRLKIFFAAPVMVIYLLFWRGLILDGWPGWFYVAQRTIAELLLSMRLLIERRKLEAHAATPR